MRRRTRYTGGMRTSGPLVAEIGIIAACTHVPWTLTALVQRLRGGGVNGGEAALSAWGDPANVMGPLAQQAGMILLVLYVLRLRGVQLRERRLGALSIAATMAVLAVIDFGIGSVASGTSSEIGEILGAASTCATHSTPSWSGKAVVGAGILVGACTEEALRAYCISRVGLLTGRPSIGAAASVCLTIAGHLYYDIPGLVSVGVSAALYALAFLWGRDVVPLVVAHACYNAVLFWIWSCMPLAAGA